MHAVKNDSHRAPLNFPKLRLHLDLRGLSAFRLPEQLHGYVQPCRCNPHKTFDAIHWPCTDTAEHVLDKYIGTGIQVANNLHLQYASAPGLDGCILRTYLSYLLDVSRWRTPPPPLLRRPFRAHGEWETPVTIKLRGLEKRKKNPE